VRSNLWALCLGRNYAGHRQIVAMRPEEVINKMKETRANPKLATPNGLSLGMVLAMKRSFYRLWGHPNVKLA